MFSKQDSLVFNTIGKAIDLYNFIDFLGTGNVLFLRQISVYYIKHMEIKACKEGLYYIMYIKDEVNVSLCGMKFFYLSAVSGSPDFGNHH